MFKSTQFLGGASRRMVLIAAFAATLTACAIPVNEPEVVSYVYRPSQGFVRIERIEPGAPDNAHPFVVSAETLRRTLASVNVAGGTSKDAVPVFKDEEIAEFAPHMAAALAKAGPKEDVTFVTAGEHGIFGKYSPKSLTTGRIFVRDNRLNVVFGMVHELHDVKYGSSGPVKPIVPGSRARRIEQGWNMVPRNAQLAANRPDWVIFDVATMQATTPSAPPAAPAQPSAPAQKDTTGATAPTTAPPLDSRSQEIENKLRLLDSLKMKGLITDEEHREQRRAILQGI